MPHTGVKQRLPYSSALSRTQYVGGRAREVLQVCPFTRVRWSLKIKIEIEMKERKEYEYKPDSFRKLSSEFRQIANVRVLYMVILYCI